MKEVDAAWREEVDHMITQKKFDVETKEECYRVTGRSPIARSGWRPTSPTAY